MGPLEQSDDWVKDLETNAFGVKLLTLRKAFMMAAAGSCAGWYIAPFALKWTVGRAAANGSRYHVISAGEPITFDSIGEAYEFLAGILRLAASPQAQPNFSALLMDMAWVNTRAAAHRA